MKCQVKAFVILSAFGGRDEPSPAPIPMLVLAASHCSCLSHPISHLLHLSSYCRSQLSVWNMVRAQYILNGCCFLTYYLFDPEKGWDMKNWTAKENGRKSFGTQETHWCGCGPPEQQLGHRGKDCVESWFVSIWITEFSHWSSSLVYLVHRANRAAGER